MTTTVNAPETVGVLQMVRAEVSVRDFQRWMGVRRMQDPDHAMHCLLTECFGRPPNEKCPERDGIAPQPFRLIIPRGAPVGCLYGYGQADADALRDAAGICSDPLQCKIIPAASIDSKPMPTEFPAGKRLGFEVRIRPVVRLNKNLDRVSPGNLRLFRPDSRSAQQEDAPRPGKECDVFLWEAIKHPEKGNMQRTREQVYADWLSNQFQCRGASLDLENTRLVSFQRTRAVRKLHRRHSEGPDAVMQGNLTVTDPAKFADMLAHGVGRHRAYGYGMLLLRPAR